MKCKQCGKRDKIIKLLKKRFPLNNPLSWSKLSDKKLKEYYQEYLKK